MKQHPNKNKKGCPLPLLALCLGIGMGMGMAACNNGDDAPSPGNGNGRVPLSVSGSMGLDFRATGTAWQAEDRLGIFMLPAGESLDEGTAGEYGFNRSYAYAGDGNRFVPASPADTLWFPQDTLQAVDFIAYHPYTPGIDRELPVLPIRLSTQTDYLYAARIAGSNRVRPQVAFAFAHLLGRMEVELVAGEGMTDGELAGATVSLSGIPTSGSCTLADGTVHSDPATSSLALQQAGTAEGSCLATLLMPSEGAAGRTLHISLAGVEKELTWTLPADKAFRAGESTVYHITLTRKTEPEPEPEPEPEIAITVTAQITGWIPGNGGQGEAGSAQ